MTLPEALELFAYNKWANDKTLASLEPVAHDLLTRDLGCSFPTLVGTAAHIAAAEWVWLSRWKGTNPTEMPEWARSPDLAGITSTFAALEAERSAWLATLAEGALAKPLPFRMFNGTEDARPLAVQFQHVVNHGTYHRGQIAVMLRQVGMAPNPTDIIRWVREKT